jgi:hypothetical protein
VRAINEAYAHVAGVLGNTPAICKASYCAPRFAELWRDGAFPELLAAAKATGSRQPLAERLAITAFTSAYGA